MSLESYLDSFLSGRTVLTHAALVGCVGANSWHAKAEAFKVRCNILMVRFDANALGLAAPSLVSRRSRPL